MQSRRQFLARSGAASAAVLAPQALMSGLASARQAPLLKSGRFAEGVASGDPAPRGITLWTRVAELERKGSVRLEVAKDKSFRKVVARDLIGTSPRTDGSVKARVTGLKPYEQYFYRFETKDGSSQVGRFRTAPPPDSRQELTFAFFSCQDWTHGFYNAHKLMANEDIDFSVCLGDYIYAESYHTVAGGTGVRDDDIGATTYSDHPHVATTLQDYRDKYALYRSDKSLRKLHAQAPMIVIWDDHEVQNNYAGGEDGGGLPPEELYSQPRREAGYAAWAESMPTYFGKRSRIYRRLKFGKTMDLIMLDQRQYRDDQPCDDAVSPACADWSQPRDLLGRTQLDWAKRQLSASKAAWKVVGNEVMMMPAKVLGDSYYTFDSWQGYPGEREELLAHIADEQIDDVVFVTGDIHTFIAGDVRRDMGNGDTVALEFVGGSITSQSLGETDLNAGGGVVLPGNDADPATPQLIIDTLRGVNPWVDQADFDHHGYGLAKVTRNAFDVTLKRVSTIKEKSTATLPSGDFRYRVERGQTSVKGVNGPAA
ncbi:MAG TPA: alkaline phosphatase D family protein [Solirubrobacteraceae bacterium]|nr:alkaline phosphatase D family protein [Solirubrobacteraceae bacterium]